MNPFTIKDGYSLKKLFKILSGFYGPQHWWPGGSRFEIIAGAVLTQNTNWKNVEKAIANMKRARCMTASAVLKTGKDELKGLIRPAGFFNQKAERLAAVSEFLMEEKKLLNSLLDKNNNFQAREKLLSIKGIGPETADSILLYAFAVPVFVVDAYTKRFLEFYHLYQGPMKYEDIRRFFESGLPADAELYNEYHALIVRWGKDARQMIDTKTRS